MYLTFVSVLGSDTSNSILNLGRDTFTLSEERILETISAKLASFSLASSSARPVRLFGKTITIDMSESLYLS